MPVSFFSFSLFDMSVILTFIHTYSYIHIFTNFKHNIFFFIKVRVQKNLMEYFKIKKIQRCCYSMEKMKKQKIKELTSSSILYFCLYIQVYLYIIIYRQHKHYHTGGKKTYTLYQHTWRFFLTFILSAHDMIKSLLHFIEVSLSASFRPMYKKQTLNYKTVKTIPQ